MWSWVFCWTASTIVDLISIDDDRGRDATSTADGTLSSHRGNEGVLVLANGAAGVRWLLALAVLRVNDGLKMPVAPAALLDIPVIAAGAAELLDRAKTHR